jgi:tRNA (cytidine/uridine-2'-O-)-methyltransferase
MLQLVLFQPDIPQNAGTMLRLCACLGLEAGLVGPASFPISDRHFRRAGLDYLDALVLRRYASFDEFQALRLKGASSGPPRRLVLLTTRGDMDYLDFRFAPDDMLMVGRESAGATEAVHEAADARLHVSMLPGMRSLNVAVAAAMVLGEALRQTRALTYKKRARS